MNASIREIPVTMSALRSVMLFSPMMKFSLFFLIALIPKHADVPMSVAGTEEITAMANVLIMAEIICLSPSISLYHLKEKPVQPNIDLPSLKENTIRVRIGR